MRIHMLRGRRLVHIAEPNVDRRGGGLACCGDAWAGFNLDGPYRNAVQVADDEPLTCKRCLRINE